jgi:hypothetical protein
MGANVRFKSTVVALIAITSLLLPFTSDVNWVSRSFWISSMLSAFLSVAFSCKHQRFVGTFLCAKDLWEFKKFLHDGPQWKPAKPKLSVVLLLSGTKNFFDLSLILYVVGLGVYLGGLLQGGADKDAAPNSSRNIFIWFMVFAVLYLIAYVAMDCLTNTGHLRGWMCHLNWYEEKFPPCVDGNCPRKICEADDPRNVGQIERIKQIEKTNEVEDAEKKHSFGWRILIFWMLSRRSRCNGTCFGPQYCDEQQVGIESKVLEGPRFCIGDRCEFGGRPHSNRSSSSSSDSKSGLKASVMEIESQDGEWFVTLITWCSNDSSLTDI